MQETVDTTTTATQSIDAIARRDSRSQGKQCVINLLTEFLRRSIPALDDDA